MTKKDRYRQLCQSEPTIPIFSRDWWLDAVCGDDWDVCLIDNGKDVYASMPYAIKRRYGMQILTMPLLTQTLGPWLKKTEGKYSNRIGIEKDLLTELITQLPTFDYFYQNWSFLNTNWMPFYWQGFQQTTRYTYRLPSLCNIDAVWSAFSENIRREIRKGSNRFNLRVRTDLSVDDFIKLNMQTFERQGMHLPYTPDFIRHLDEACLKNNARKIFIAEDDEGQRHAGVYIIWDEQSAYYLMGGGDPKLRTSGATSLCMWEAIQFASNKTKSFDFEGSMIQQVERFFRAFGAIQTPYFSLSKTPSRLIRLQKNLVNIIR